MRRQITGSVRAGETVTRVAERLLDIGKPIVRLPRHVEDLRDAARMAVERGDRNLYIKAVDKWRGTVERLGQGAGLKAGEHTVRSATQQLVKDLGSAKLEQVDEFVDRWVVERARYQARVIARTEAVEAFRNQYQESMAAQPHVVGFRWTLSGSHPKPDVCEIFASQDLDGLGPGGYKAGNVPSNPHPHCLCSIVAIVDAAYFKRELAKLKGEEEPPKPWESGARETGQDWVSKQPETFQKQLLGPTRFSAMKAGVHVIDPKGVPRPVHEILGKNKPVRRLGTPVNAVPAVKRDRQGQVRPFPHVPPVPGSRKPPAPTGAAPATAVARGSGGGGRSRRPPGDRPLVQAARERNRARAEARQLQTPEYWLEQGLEAKYGTEVGKAIAHGRAVEHQGRAVPIKEAKTELLDLERASVHVLYNGAKPVETAESRAGRTFKTLGDAINHFESQGQAVMANQLRVSAALVGHCRAIEPAPTSIQLRDPILLPDAKLTLTQARHTIGEAQRFFERMADKTLVHPVHHELVVDDDPRGFYSAAQQRIHIGNGTPGKLAHEWAHALEELNPVLGARAREYLANRTKGWPRRALKDLVPDGDYDDDEFAVEDRLFHPYMGKDYGGYFTEITSHMVETLVRRPGNVKPGHLHTALARDPDSFYFVLGQLAGDLR